MNRLFVYVVGDGFDLPDYCSFSGLNLWHTSEILVSLQLQSCVRRSPLVVNFYHLFQLLHLELRVCCLASSFPQVTLIFLHCCALKK
ncbi:hypothetical protein N665_0094s0042 [Sinapis alba]|nr:hypothetical protein N665_0094s0042 [Sinapis alba]